MRIYFPNESRPKSIAKKLKDLAPEFGLQLKLKAAREATAFIYGYRNWEELRTLSRTFVPTSLDDRVGPEEVEQRAQYQARRLSERLSIPLATALEIVERIKPTKPVSSSQPAQIGFREAIADERALRALLAAADLRHAADGGVFFPTTAGMDAGVCIPFDDGNQPNEIKTFLTLIIGHDGGLWFHVDVIMDDVAERALAAARAGNPDYSLISHHSSKDPVSIYSDGDDLEFVLDTYCGRMERGQDHASHADETLNLAARISAAASGRLDLPTLIRVAEGGGFKAEAYNLLVGASGQPDSVRDFFSRYPAFLALYEPMDGDRLYEWNETDPLMTAFMRALGECGNNWARGIFEFGTRGDYGEPDENSLDRCRRLLEAFGNSATIRNHDDSLAGFLMFMARHGNAQVPQGEEEIASCLDFFARVETIASEMGWGLWDICMEDEFPATWKEAHSIAKEMIFTPESHSARFDTAAKVIAVSTMDLNRPLVPQVRSLAESDSLKKAAAGIAELPYFTGLFETWALNSELAAFERDEHFASVGGEADEGSLRRSVARARELARKVQEAHRDLALGPDPSRWIDDLEASVVALNRPRTVHWN